MLRECPIVHRCMRGLAPSRVFESVEAILARPGRVPAGEPQ
jgi:hypothetical protein